MRDDSGQVRGRVESFPRGSRDAHVRFAKRPSVDVRVEARIDGFQNIRRSSEDVWRRVVVVVVVVVLEDVSHACSR